MTTLQQLAQNILNDPAYLETVKTRAHAGTLDPNLELLLWEMADGRTPMSADRPVPMQSRTLALVRPIEEEQRDA
jgi:hypothetical protein